jgi:transposase
LFSEITLSACRHEGIEITYGHSKDHRSDLKQAVLEMMVSQDGGVPFFSKPWNGDASDNVIFRERAEALIEGFNKADTRRYLIADSKLYAAKSVPFLVQLSYITRILGTLSLEGQLNRKALGNPTAWGSLDDTSASTSATTGSIKDGWRSTLKVR